MAFLRLESITKRFPGCLAVDRLDLDADEGDFVVLLGPSGCGKTTTLRIIAGLEIQTDGQVILGGRDISDVPPERRDMAMVFQNLALYPHMTVFDNIAFYLRNIRRPKDEIRDRVAKAANRVQIGELLDRYPDQLSGGQRQRVALARALVRSPKVFLLDEPLAALDAKLRAGMRSEFKLLHKSLVEEAGGVSGTFIYVTHDQVEALTLGTRIAVMNEGRIAQIASPSDLYRRPRNIFTATFVGSPEMNLLEGKLQRANGDAVFRFRNLEVDAGAKGLAALGRAKEETIPAIMGIRPESIHLVRGETLKALDAEIVTLELLGQSNLLMLKIDDLPLTCLANPDIALRENERIAVRFEAESMHFFDPKTEESLLVDEE
ncbi:MAG: ABC transporter ATP-binding protein [Anaerolineae bacterium]|nr:MAG: ABC transporter ATP-binding protein [Anaerolineae bacterium]